MSDLIIVGGKGKNGTVSVLGKDETKLAEMITLDNEAVMSEIVSQFCGASAERMASPSE
jgi:hypothetical protein